MSTLGVLPPFTPSIAADVSGVATMTGAVTFKVTLAVAQLVGLIFSQIVYGYTYVPAGVPGFTVMVPSAFITIPPDAVTGAVPGVKVTVVVLTGWPLSVSLPSTVDRLPPSPPLTGVAVRSSSMAWIATATTLTAIVVVAQFAGLSFSQIM